MPWSKKIVFIFFFSFVSSGAIAQESLSLSEAIALGLKNNFDIQIQKLDLEIARKNNTWGQAGRYPTVSFNANQNNQIVQRKPANPFAVPGRSINDNINGQLDAQFVLFNGFAINLTKERLEQLEDLSYGNSAFVIEGVVQGIVLAYYQSLLDKENLTVLEKNLAYSKERYEFVKLRKELGSAITFDVLQEQNNYLTDSANVLRQEIFYRNTVRNLNVLLSDSLDRHWVFTDSLYYAGEDYTYNDLHTRMVRSNTNLKNQFINQELLRNNTKLQQSNLYPSINLNVGANGSLDRLNANFRSSTGPEQKNTIGYVNDDTNFPVIQTNNQTLFVNQSISGNSYGGYANLSLRWTLFNGKQIKRSIENAQINEKIGTLTTNQLTLSLENDLLASYDLYNLRKQLVAIASVNEEAAVLNLDLANERYRNGALSAIDLRIVQENARNAAIEKSLAIFALITSRTELVRLTGGIIETYPVE